jgi:hypothetical protein
VSILIATIGPVGRCQGAEPRAKVSMMIMRPPQSGQGCVSLSSAASAGAAWGLRQISRSPRTKGGSSNPSLDACGFLVRTQIVWAKPRLVLGRGDYRRAQELDFAGSDEGGRRAAAIYTLIQTAKLNDIGPQAWLADILARLPDHPAKRIPEVGKNTFTTAA